MLDFKTFEVKLGDQSTGKILTFLNYIWIGIPKWLRNLMLVTVMAGGMYYLYNRISLSYDVDEIQADVNELNERIGSTVFKERYQYDIQNVIQTVKTIEAQMDGLYMFNEALLNLLIEHMKMTTPDDYTILRRLQIMKDEQQRVKEYYNTFMEYQYQ